LIDRGADKDTLDTQGYTAIHHATYGDKSGEALKLLLERGFSPNIQHNDNRATPLHLAVKNNNEMAVQILTQHSECDVNLQDEAGDTPLHDAIGAQKPSMVDMLLNNPGLSVTVTNQRGFNYLQFAVLKGNTQAVDKLLAKAGDILNVPKSDGFTTLHIAAINDHREIAKILLMQPGCLVDALTKDNQTALHLAASEGYSAMTEILLDHGASVNARDNDGDTPLHITLAKESVLKTNLVAQLPALQLLLRGGNSRCYADVSRCLLSYGADVRQTNRKGETPLDNCEDTEVEQLIREIADSTGETQVKKVPTFGGTRHSDTDALRNPSTDENSSAPEEAQGGQETVVHHAIPRVDKDGECGDVSCQEQSGQVSNETASREEGGQERMEECSDGNHQEQSDHLLDEAANQEVGVQEGNEEARVEDVSLDNNLVDNSMEQIQENIVLEVTNQVQQPVPTAEVTNGSVNAAVQVTIMNNGVAANDENGILESSNSTLMEARVFETIDEDTKMDESTETEAKEERPKCQICEENEADVAFKPCGHIVVCAECASRLKRCLECKVAITGKAKRDGTPITGINDKSLTSKYQLLEKRMRKLEESVVCCICVERKKNMIFLCGHGTCQSCADQLETCPICQKSIEKKIPIF